MPVKTVDAVSTPRSPETTETAETTGSQGKITTREKINNTTKDAVRPWHCIMCKFLMTSPAPLTAHMTSNHWEYRWTIRIENTQQEFKFATKGTTNQVQTKCMGTITKHTKKATQIETNNAMETTARTDSPPTSPTTALPYPKTSTFGTTIHPRS